MLFFTSYRYWVNTFRLQWLGGLIFFLFCTMVCGGLAAEPWWTQERLEDEQTIEDGITYQRFLFQNDANKPVRAHILSVTNIGSNHLLGVLGSYGVLFPPTDYAQHSEAVAMINGGFYSASPNRALGMVMAHGKFLYPPASAKLNGTVGFTGQTMLIDRILPHDIKENQYCDTKAKWNDVYSALGAGPILVKNSRVVIQNASAEFNLTQTAPRSAIGITPNNNALLVVVDGRQPDWSAGATLEELAELFSFLNAKDALNLDGGGSSVMIINKQVVNRPSDESIPGYPGKVRPVANVIGLFNK